MDGAVGLYAADRACPIEQLQHAFDAVPVVVHHVADQSARRHARTSSHPRRDLADGHTFGDAVALHITETQPILATPYAVNAILKESVFVPRIRTNHVTEFFALFERWRISSGPSRWSRNKTSSSSRCCNQLDDLTVGQSAQSAWPGGEIAVLLKSLASLRESEEQAMTPIGQTPSIDSRASWTTRGVEARVREGIASAGSAALSCRFPYEARRRHLRDGE